MRRLTILMAGLVLFPLAAAGAPLPTALAQVTGGLWEISGAPASRAPVRECITDVLSLAQFEHRTRKCSRTILSNKPSSTVINYSCGSAGFGESEVDVITPRSLRISTQGISDQLPFNYVLQARRIGECTKDLSPPRH